MAKFEFSSSMSKIKNRWYIVTKVILKDQILCLYVTCFFLCFIHFILSSFQEKEPEAANGKVNQISSTFFGLWEQFLGFWKNLEKKVCDLWKSTSPNTKRAILAISALLFLIILIALIAVAASTGSSCDTGQKISKAIFPCLQFFLLVVLLKLDEVIQCILILSKWQSKNLPYFAQASKMGQIHSVFSFYENKVLQTGDVSWGQLGKVW